LTRRDDVSHFVRRRDVEGTSMEGHVSCRMLNESHGCVAGFCSGITVYTASEHPTTGAPVFRSAVGSTSPRKGEELR